jgi:hypothetical protein
LSLAYGWTPRQIGELTLAQILAYHAQSPDPGEVVEVDPAAARRLGERAAREKQRFVARHMALAGTR